MTATAVEGREPRTRVAVVGAGGIGSALGAALAGSADVTLICRGAHLAAIRRDGLRMIGPGGDSVRQVHATDQPASVGPVDVIISCVKLYDLAAVTRQMLPMVGPGTFVIPVQNGVTAHEEIGAILGEDRVLGGTVFMSSFVREPGVVELRSAHASMTFGELYAGGGDRAAAFASVCESAGIRAHVVDGILGALWRKFIMLGGTAALSCLSRQSIGGIRADPVTRDLLLRAMGEVLAVARAKGLDIPDSLLDEGMAFADSVNAETRVSMLEDIEAGKPLELEWITGHIVRLARAAGIAVPINEIAYACTRHLAAGTGSPRRAVAS
jgi:2-dehydropantoate 2-reductase